MAEWWSSLTVLNQVLFCIAGFFSVLFLWQLIAALLGMVGGGSDVDVHTDFHADVPAHVDVGSDLDAAHGIPPGHVPEHLGTEGIETMASFRLVSVRSIVAFGMLFGWAGALYLQEGTVVGRALLYALLWAVIGMAAISTLFYLMQRMTESGAPRLVTCVGQPATVYMNIPSGGAGKVRTLVSGAIAFINARAAGGEALVAGTPVRVTRLLDSTTVEVEKTS